MILPGAKVCSAKSATSSRVCRLPADLAIKGGRVPEVQALWVGWPGPPHTTRQAGRGSALQPVNSSRSFPLSS